MLSRESRLTSSQDFSRVVRHGRRAGARTLVVHLDVEPGGPQPRVGFVVSKAVGPAVVRSRVKRRLRHLCRGRISGLPRGALVVVRALAPSATAGHAALEADLDHALRRALVRTAARAGTPQERA